MKTPFSMLLVAFALCSSNVYAEQNSIEDARIQIASMHRVAIENDHNKIFSSLNIKQECVEPARHSGILFSKYSIYLKQNDRTEAEQTLTELSKFRTNLYSSRSSCFDSVLRALTFWSVKALTSTYKNNIPTIAMYLLATYGPDGSPRISWLSPRLRENHSWCHSFSSGRSKNFSLMGAYDCKSGRVLVDPFLPPFDLAASFVHEISHLMLDMASRSIPNRRLDYQSLLVWDEFSAAMGAGFVQAILRNDIETELDLPFPEYRNSIPYRHAGKKLHSESLARYWKGYPALTRNQYDLDLDFTLFNLGGKLTGWMYEYLHPKIAFQETMWSATNTVRWRFAKYKDHRLPQAFSEAVDFIHNVYFGTKLKDHSHLGDFVNQSVGAMVPDVGTTQFHWRLAAAFPTAWSESSVLQPSFSIQSEFLASVLTVRSEPSPYCKAFSAHSIRSTPYEGLRLNSGTCRFEDHFGYPSGSNDETYLDQSPWMETGPVHPGGEGVKVCIHPGN